MQDALGRRSGSLIGATQFVDISGFTALTEVLMQHGKEGAEVLGEALRRTFNPLVDAVEEAGGFITGFAGDAFTAIYPHVDDHDVPAYALQASRRMQAFFAEHGTVETPYGEFAFAVKVGLSWGEVEWEIFDSPSQGAFTVADPPSYVFRGFGVDSCADAEKHANKGQTVLHKAFAAYVPIRELEELAEEAFLDVGEHTQSLPPLSLTPPESTGPSRFLPKEIEAFPKSGEFRRVAVVFLSFSEITSLQALTHTIQRTLRRYGGTFTRLDFGDKGGNCLMFFGVPTSHENNEERALDFILDLFRQLAKQPFALRAGVTQNIMYAGFNGGQSRHEFACLGRAVTMAARLMMKAGWGEIWCGPKIHKRTHNLFAFDSLDQWFLKGFQEPINVYTLKQRKERDASTFASVSLVGREGELKRLLNGCQQAISGHFSGFWFVDGEAGMGKSYLVASCQQQLAAHCESTGQPYHWILAPTHQTLQGSLHPFTYALRHWGHQSPQKSKEENRACLTEALEALRESLPQEQQGLRDELTRLSSFLGALVGLFTKGSLYEQLEPRFRFANTLQAIVTWLQALSHQRPVILQLEDGHWLDPASLQAIRQLAQQAHAKDWPLTIILTNRYLDDGRPFRLPLPEGVPQQTINLNQLSRGGLRSLAEGHLGDTIHPQLIDLLEVKGHGNPFFVEQILSYLQEQQALRPTEQGLAPIETGVILPEGVNSVLIARLDRLSSQAKQAVQVASTLGREFRGSILCEVIQSIQEEEPSQLPPEAAIESGMDARIWSHSGPDAYLFLHALMRDAAYDMQARARLRVLHEYAGLAFEQAEVAEDRPPFGEMAYHFDLAGNQEKAQRYLEKAGDEARADYRNQEALGHYQKLLPHLPQTGERTRRVHLAMAQVMQVLQKIEEGLQHCEQAEQAMTEASPEVCYQKAFLTQMKGDFDRARALIQEAITLAQEQSLPEWESRCLNSLGVLHLYKSEIDEADRRFQQSLAIAQAHQLQQLQAKAISNMAGVAMARKELGQTQLYLEQSLFLARQVKDRWTEFLSLGNLGELYLQMDQAEQALTSLGQCIQTGTEIGTKNANFMANYAQALHQLSRLAEAQDVLDEAELFARGAGNTKHIIDVLYARSQLHHTNERAEAAREALTEALALAQSSKQKALEDKLKEALSQLAG